MKYFLSLLLLAGPCAAAEPQPCAVTAAGCASTRASSPFLEAASAAEPVPAPEKGPAPAAQAVYGAVAAPEGASESPAQRSSPLWALFAAGGVVLLYRYLAARPPSRRKK